MSDLSAYNRIEYLISRGDPTQEELGELIALLEEALRSLSGDHAPDLLSIESIHLVCDCCGCREIFVSWGIAYKAGWERSGEDHFCADCAKEKWRS